MALVVTVLGLYATLGACSLEEACCARDYAGILLEPTCAAKVAGGSLGAVYGVPMALGWLGFGVLGPVGGSIAALIQAAGGSGAIFAFLQSLGMTGIGAGGALTGASVAYTLCCAGVSCAVR